MGQEKHPKGLYILFFTEMWERFSFYLMLGILPLYLTDRAKGGMGWSDDQMAVVVGSYMGLVYFTPFLGGLIADRLLGCRKTILIGATCMMIGHLVLAWPSELGLFLGLGFLILGNGGFKPNISTLLGNLYPPGSPLKDSGYNIFYMGINIGGFVCNFVAALVRNHFDDHPLQITSTWTLAGWHAAFATAGVGMFIGLVLFAVNFRRFAAADQSPSAAEGSASGESLAPLFLQCLLPAVVLAAFGWFAAAWVHGSLPGWMAGWLPASPQRESLSAAWKALKPPTLAFLAGCLPVIYFYLRIWRGVPDRTDRGRVAALLIIFAIAMVFWVTYGLNTTALTVWTRDDTSRQTNVVIEPVTNAMPEFAENAPPDYYYNADARVPRPDRATFEVIDPARYKAMEEKQELSVKTGEKVYVTQDMLRKVYQNTTPETPVLAEREHLKLVNTELFQSINPGFIILFTPLVVGLWRFLQARGKEPSTPAKMGMGLFIEALAPAVMLGATLVSHDGQTKASAAWLFGTYAAVGLGELFLSSMGLSLVSKISPAALRASMMGGWFLSTALGLKVSGIFGEVHARMTTETEHALFWVVLIAANVAAGGVIFLLLPWLKRQMAEGQLNAGLTPVPDPSLAFRASEAPQDAIQGLDPDRRRQ